MTACGIWPLVVVYALMIIGFISVRAIPLYFMDRSERRRQGSGGEDR